MIGSEYSPHSLNQSDYILNPTATTSLVFSRASGSLLVFTLFLSCLSDIFLYPDWTQSAWVVFCFRHSIEERLNISTSNSFTFRLQWKLSEKNQDFQNLSFHNELRLIACWIRRCLVGKRWLFQVTAIQIYIDCFQVLIFEFIPTGQSRFDVQEFESSRRVLEQTHYFV